jgi:hypothetical protein
MKNLTITIKYKFYNSSKWHTVDFSPNEYFDLDADEKAEWDCVPLYNDSLDYLDIEKTLVQYIETTIIDIEATTTQIFTETLWNQGNNRITETDVSGLNSWNETIIQIKLEDNPPTWEILRYRKENNFSKLSYHGLIIDNEDGSQAEKIIYKS